MKRIHIELVGKQSQPIYMMLKQISPDEVYFICSDQTQEIVETIISQFDAPPKYKTFDLEPHDLASIYEDIDSIATLIDDNDILSLNLIGGTKFWSLAFYQKFCSRPNTHFFLIGQDNTLWNLKDSTWTNVEAIDLDTIFSLQGQKISSYKNFLDYTPEDSQAVKTLESIQRKSPKEFQDLAAVLTPDKQTKLQQDQGSFTDKKGNEVTWEKPNLVTFCIKGEEFHIQSPHAVALTFNSNWFEYKVAELVDSWDKAKEVRLNNIFDGFKNEVDIIVTTDVKPIFIECKTSLHKHTDVDKFRTVVENFGGMASAAILISNTRIKKIALDKCHDSNIAYFCLADEPSNYLKESLHYFLDQVLETVNA